MRTMIAVLMAALPLAGQTDSPSRVKVDFIRDVEPILAQKCHSCHGPQVQQAGLRLDRRQNAMRGGDYGPVIVPGNSSASKLIRRVVSGDGGMQMPPSGALPPDEIAVLRAWVNQGADFTLEVKPEAPPSPIDPKLKALITAVRSNDHHAIGEALAADPGLIRRRDSAGSSPLHHAAGFASLATLELLLDKGADANARNGRKSTPLFWAIHDAAKVRALIAKGADVNVRQADGRTPLFQAASIGNGSAVFDLLIGKGADPNVANATGQTPLMPPPAVAIPTW